MKRTHAEQARWRFDKQRRSNLIAKPGPHEFVLVLEALKPDFNIGKIFRSADAFGAKEIHLVGIDYFDPAPAVGSFKWIPAIFHNDIESCLKALSEGGFELVALGDSSAEPLNSVALPLRSAFIIGHEEFGLSEHVRGRTDVRLIGIRQFGKVESLNASVAASIVMYDYCRQHRLLNS